MKKIFFGVFFTLNIASFSQSTNPFQQSEDLKKSQQIDETSKPGPAVAADPVPINDHITYLLIAGVVLIFAASKKMKPAK